MAWMPILNTGVNQVYGLKGRSGDVLTINLNGREFSLHFDRSNADLYRLFSEVQYVLLPSPEGPVLPARQTADGWEYWDA